MLVRRSLILIFGSGCGSVLGCSRILLSCGLVVVIVIVVIIIVVVIDQRTAHPRVILVLVTVRVV